MELDSKQLQDISKITSGIQKALNAFKLDFNERTAGLRETIQRSNERYKTYLTLLANYGWYISPHLIYKDFFEILLSIKKKQISKAETFLIEYYSKNIDDIKKNMIEKYPARKKIITEAFKAHKRKMYFSSTILFLSLADGMCNGKLFILRNDKKELNKFLRDKNNIELFIHVLGKENAIDSGYSNKSNYFSELNRHQVMHGLYNNYGNKINSLKALSLLCFIAEFGRHKTN